ncbi:unnamed protein product [Chondrus crispus]|uniref:Uncharacterized protein n=1 Tax=Chondrus crispus TaxID=2769 RepID=R7QSJ1_CHOCR|nr:unnamed protein product [Chondrus crispus]CDF40355.1 unnamed protein product [Chondrus crispus]|eukprot:XP_005710649.1 unnamed protein product [Chondrus crispus]
MKVQRGISSALLPTPRVIFRLKQYQNNEHCLRRHREYCMWIGIRRWAGGTWNRLLSQRGFCREPHPTCL